MTRHIAPALISLVLVLVLAGCPEPRVTDDRTGPGPTSALAAAATGFEVSVTWTSPTDADLATLLVVRYAGGQTNGEPQPGLSYQVGDRVGSGTVVYVGDGTDEQFVDSVQCGTYTYQTWASDLAGNWSTAQQQTLEVEALPTDSPRALVAISTQGGVDLRWTNPENDPSFDHVVVVRNASVVPTDVSQGVEAYRGNAETFIDTEVGGGQWYYAAFACNACGRCESTGDVVTVTIRGDDTAPSDVSNGQFLAGNTEVNIVWQDPTTADFQGVRIVRKQTDDIVDENDGTLVCTGCMSPTTDAGLVNGTVYYYKLFVYDAVPRFSVGVGGSATPAAAVMEVLTPGADPGEFGGSVDADGNTLVVGSPMADGGALSSGVVYTYERSDGVGGSAFRVAPSIAYAGARFGAAVAVDGDTLVIGAPGALDAAGDAVGAAYVYERTGPNTWGNPVRLDAGDPQKRSDFGEAVAVNGDLVVIGQKDHDDAGGLRSTGALWVFERSGAGNRWGAATKIAPPVLGQSFRLGVSVGVSGDWIIAGVLNQTSATGFTRAGAAYLFQRLAPGTWSAGEKISAPSPTQYDQFGWSVAIENGYAIVGARQRDVAGQSMVGSAWIFRNTGGSNWSDVFELPDSIQDAYAYFGWDVDIHGDYAIVGVREGESAGLMDSGTVHTYTRTGTNTWVETDVLVSLDPERNGRFGTSVALSAGHAVVGASGETPNGSAYLLPYQAASGERGDISIASPPP